MSRTRALTDVEEVEVAERYKAGLSTWKLAHRFGVGQATIRRSLERQGIQMRPGNPRRDVDDDVIGELRTSRHTWAEIASLTGLSPTSCRERYHVWLERRERTPGVSVSADTGEGR